MGKLPFPTIRTERLLMRQIQEDDLSNVFRGLSHPDVIAYYGVSYNSLEETKQQMEFYANLERDKTGIWWAICSAGDDTFYGAGGLNAISWQHRKCEIGFWLMPEFWGHGIMTEAMPLICNYGFERLGLHRIEGFVETENTICRRAMQKLKFTHEGTLRDCEIKNGVFVSLDIYALIKERQNHLS